MENTDIKVTPPRVEDADGMSDTLLLKAISENPDCAHVLAEIARGGDAATLLRTLLDDKAEAPEAEPANDAPVPQPEDVPMFRSPSMAPERAEGDSFPLFLSDTHPDFWEGF